MRRTHQQEGPDVGDLVELHEEPQSLLVVAAVLAVDGEALPLQGGERSVGSGSCWRTGGLTVLANGMLHVTVQWPSCLHTPSHLRIDQSGNQ